MGVDFYNCELCGEIFADAGHWGHCGGCESMMCGYCYDEMRKKNGELGSEHERADFYGEEAPNCCDKCDGTIIDTEEFIAFLIRKIGGATRDELEKEFSERQE